MPPVLQRLLANVGVGRIRREPLEGRPHVVAPTAMIGRGVLNGSAGPIFYDDPDMIESVSAWNHKPLVVYHPEDDEGNKVSACLPAVLNSRKVGVILNTVHDGKLRTESWFDEERTKAIDGRVIKALDAGKPIECSTGLYVDVEAVNGNYEGTDYVGIARNYKPDHLAVLPDQLGAYPVSAGGGILTVNAAARQPDSLRHMMEGSLKEAAKRCGLLNLKVNELSYNGVTTQLADLLRSKFGEPGKYWDGCLFDVYPNRVVFTDGYGKMFAIDYEVKDDAVSLLGDAQPVTRVVEYKAVGNGVRYTANAAGLLVPQEEVKMAFDKKSHLASLVGAGDGWDEQYVEALGKALTDEQLEKIKPKKKEEPVENKKKEEPPITKVQETPAKAKWEEVLANADPETQDFLAAGLESGRREKKMLVDAILANEDNTFTKEYLESLKLTVLKPMARLAGVGNAKKSPNYAFAAGFDSPPPTTNATEEEPLPLPTLD